MQPKVYSQMMHVILTAHLIRVCSFSEGRCTVKNAYSQECIVKKERPFNATRRLGMMNVVSMYNVTQQQESSKT